MALPQGRNVLVAVAGGNQLDSIPQVLRDRFPRMDVVDLNGTGSRFGLAQKSYLNDQTLTLIASICRISDVDMPTLRREEERRKRTLAIRVTASALILLAVLATLLVFALIQRRVAVTQRTSAEARSLGLAAVSDFAAGRQTRALLEAVDGGRKLESLVKPDTPFDHYPDTTPLLALSTVLDTIHEKNRLEHSQNTDGLQGNPTVNQSEPCSIPGVLSAPTPSASITDSVMQTVMHSTGRILAKGCMGGGRYVISTATDGTVRMIDNVDHPEAQIIGLQGAATVLSFAPDSTKWKTIDVWGTVVDWDMEQANPGRRIGVLDGDQTSVTGIAWSPDATSMVTGSRSGLIRIWSAAGGLVAEQNPTHEGILAIQFTPEGKDIVAFDQKGAVQRLDKSGKLLLSQTNLQVSYPIQARFSPNGSSLAVSIAGGSAELVALEGGQPVRVGRGHRGWVMASSVSPLGSMVATAGADDTIEVSRASGEAVCGPIQAAQDQVVDVAFSPDGKVLASAGANGTTKLWTLEGQLIRTLIGHTGKVLTVRFSPNGQLIATAGQDGTVRLWTSTGLQLGQFAGSKGALSQEVLGGDFGGAGLAFSPDSAKIAIAQSGGTVALYRIQTLGELVETGCAWLKPHLDSHPEVPNPCRQSQR